VNTRGKAVPAVPILITPPLTQEQETRIREIVREEIAAWYNANIPGAVDRDKKPYTPKQADIRGVWAYDQVREGGYSEKRLDSLEAADVTNAARDAAEAAEQDAIQAALSKPILPGVTNA